MTDLIHTDISDKILTITMNRPEKKNAITQAMYGVMADAMEAARSDDSVRVIVLKANGDLFTAGNDLIDFQQAAANLDESRPVMRFLAELVAADKPIVAAVNGLAVGIGLTVLLHCDFIYMAEEAQLQAPFVDLALVPEAASSLLLVDRIGHARAAEVFMLGKRITSDEALAWGLANGVCSLDGLLPKVMEVATLLTRKAPKALQAAKMLMRGDKAVLEAKMKEELVYFDQQLLSAEVAEAVMAFFEKRPPVFK